MKRSTSVRSGLSFWASAVERGPVGPAWIHRLVSGAFGVTLTASPRNLLALDPSMQVEVDRWGPGHDFSVKHSHLEAGRACCAEYCSVL